jgi:OOP family OmpA-OmpF porin
MRKTSLLAVTSCLTSLATYAPAQTSADASAELSLSGDGAAASGDTNSGEALEPDTAGQKPWPERYPAENGLFELGFFGGLLLPSKAHNFHQEEKPQVPFRRVAPEFGLRAAFFPVGFLGVEGEGALMPTSATDDSAALLYSVRGHLIAQLPMWSIQPFVVFGGSGFGAKNDSNGDDADPGVHFGGGVKAAINELLAVRLDLRDNLTQKNADDPAEQRRIDGDPTHHAEVLLGLSVVLGRAAPPPAPPRDTDGDGIVDREDSCPNDPGPEPDGCPPPPDMDADGIADSDDKCPSEAGPKPEGCPLLQDSDGDGILDDQDKCPDTPGIAPDGCPDPDPDKDGITGAADQCPDEPETRNGYQDQDGCPDEIPSEVKKFTGVIAGIEFDFGKSTIRPGSRPLLDEAAKILNDYPDLQVEIAGHTDNVGAEETNIALSEKRAESVKSYLVSKGVAEERIKTRGAGPSEPLESNDTPEGRQKNRRIEFKLLTQ